MNDGLRQERAQALWRRWRWPVLGGALGLVAAVAAVEGWSGWQAGKQEAAFLAYREAVAVSDEAFDARLEAEEAAAAEEAESGAEGAEEAEGEEEASGLDEEALREELGIPALFYDTGTLPVSGRCRRAGSWACA